MYQKMKVKMNYDVRFIFAKLFFFTNWFLISETPSPVNTPVSSLQIEVSADWEIANKS